MLAQSPVNLINGDLFIALNNIFPRFSVNLKLEGLSITGSIKIKPGAYMIRALERSGRIGPDARIIESSSGNLGLALSMICASKGYRFTCVSDPNISPQSAKLIQAYGAELIIVRERDASGGYLATRIDLIKNMLQRDKGLVWVNQYENFNNVDAHRSSTAREILNRFPRPDYVFVGAGTTGTLGGVSAALREKAPNTKIIAVDSVGSVTFGGAPGKRHIPGLGTSAPPPIRKYSSFDELLMIPEADTVAMCRHLARRGLLLGGSSGTVMSGVARYAAEMEAGACIVAISPDMGDRYVDTIYDDEWVETKFPGLLEDSHRKVA